MSDNIDAYKTAAPKKWLRQVWSLVDTDCTAVFMHVLGVQKYNEIDATARPAGGGTGKPKKTPVKTIYC